jgi:hypothetical protein
LVFERYLAYYSWIRLYKRWITTEDATKNSATGKVSEHWDGGSKPLRSEMDMRSLFKTSSLEESFTSDISTTLQHALFSYEGPLFQFYMRSPEFAIDNKCIEKIHYSVNSGITKQ